MPVSLFPFQLLKKLIHSYKIWYERYAIVDYSVFCSLVVTADVQLCEVGVTLGPLNLGFSTDL
jgi:hypothetical protein